MTVLLRIYTYFTFIFVILSSGTFANESTLSGTLLSPEGELRGVFKLIPAPGGLLVSATLENMPVGKHAFHLHANPSCADSFNAAGGQEPAPAHNSGSAEKPGAARPEAEPKGGVRGGGGPPAPRDFFKSPTETFFKITDELIFNISTHRGEKNRY